MSVPGVRVRRSGVVVVAYWCPASKGPHGNRTCTGGLTSARRGRVGVAGGGVLSGDGRRVGEARRFSRPNRVGGVPSCPPGTSNLRTWTPWCGSMSPCTWRAGSGGREREWWGVPAPSRPCRGHLRRVARPCRRLSAWLPRPRHGLLRIHVVRGPPHGCEASRAQGSARTFLALKRRARYSPDAFIDGTACPPVRHNLPLL